MYRINGGGTSKYKGQVLNKHQENIELLESILKHGDVLPCPVSHYQSYGCISSKVVVIMEN